MAEVALQGLYLAPLSDYTEQIVLNAGVTLSESGGPRGEVRIYAGGRLRRVTRAGRPKSTPVRIAYTDRATRETLESWEGVTLMLRDGRGRLIFGSFLPLAVEEVPGLPYCHLSFTFDALTHSVEV